MAYKKMTGIVWGMILSMLMITISPGFSIPLDSLRTEEIDGKFFIIHQIDQGETLYALSRRYKVSVPDITSYNPSTQSGLEIGSLIRIPLIKPKNIIAGAVTHIVKPKETLFSIAQQYEIKIEEVKSLNNLVTNELSIGQILYIKSRPALSPTVEDTDYANKTTHQLQQGETLYSISKKYEISIEQLKSWNHLQDNTLSIGQLLIVGDNSSQTPVDIKDTIPKARDTTAIDTTTTTYSETLPINDTTYTSKRTANINGFEEIVETGIGELIPGSTEKRKYLGFHRTVKIGTIVKVRNEMNNKFVFVRIIGRIPDTGDNSKVLLKISKAAYDGLGIIDPRFRVEISYMP